MKLATLFALLATAEAVRVRSHHKAQHRSKLQLKKDLNKLILLKAKDECLTDEEINGMLEEGGEAAGMNGNDTLDPEECVAASEGDWSIEECEAFIFLADCDGDDELSYDEAFAFLHQHACGFEGDLWEHCEDV